MAYKNRKIIKGKVVNVRPKTIVVEKEILRAHRIYKKIIKTTKKHHAHDEHEIAKKNDIVLICATRRYSKLKAFKLVQVVNKK